MSFENCAHENHILSEGYRVCVECGMTFENVSFDKDWKYYNQSFKDPARCHKAKSTQRNMYNDVKGMQFPDSIVESANEKYQEIISDGSIFRGERRKAIVVACLFFAHIEHGNPIPVKDLASQFKLRMKKVSEGLTIYTGKFPDLRNQYIEPKHLIKRIMIEVGINNRSHYLQIQKLCEKLENTSELMNSSNPQSIASAIVYLYLCMKPSFQKELGLTKSKYAKMVKLSDATVEKLVKDAASTLRVKDRKSVV